MRRYTLTIDEKQADALIAALDLYSRLHSGQYEELREIGLARAVGEVDWSRWHRRNDSLISDLKLHHFGLPGNASHSIHSEKVPLLARIAYDVEQVIRKQVAEDRGMQEWHVWLRDFLTTSGHPFVAQICREDVKR